MKSPYKHMMSLIITLLLIMSLLPFTASYSDIPKTINYQGRLTDNLDVNVPDGEYQIAFSIYPDSTGGGALWSSGQQSVTVTDGLFIYQLGKAVTLPDDLFSSGANRWLGIKVGEDPEIAPRTRLISSPYTFHALRADTANYALASPGGDGIWSKSGTRVYLNSIEDSVAIGTTLPLANLHVEGDIYIDNKATIGSGNTNSGYQSFISGEGNTANGNYSAICNGTANQVDGDYSSIAGGHSNYVSGDYSTVAGGQADSATGIFSFVAGGSGNVAEGNFSTILGGSENHTIGEATSIGGGKYNTANGTFSSISGGGPTDIGNPTSTSNRIYDSYGAIGGGGGNQVGSDNGLIDDDEYGTVGGGMNNLASEAYSIVGGGQNNSAAGYASAIGGGSGNSVTGNYSHVSAGSGNAANGTGAAVGGGSSNTASANYATVSGGQNNTATGQFSTINGGIGNNSSANFAAVGGGLTNTAGGDYAAVSGGKYNAASGLYANIGGGESDTASADWSSVAGGYMNSAEGTASTVCGGESNSAFAEWSAIGGGQNNSTSGQHATVPGGLDNQAAGAYSLAAGRNAGAVHDGSFVWADSNSADFNSTAENQFLISAENGVGIGTNAPSEALEVTGTIYSNTGGFKFPDGSTQFSAVKASVIEENYMNSSSIPVEIDTAETTIISETITGGSPGIITGIASGNIMIDHEYGSEMWYHFAINTQPDNIWYEGGAIKTIRLSPTLPTGVYVLNFAVQQSFYTTGNPRELYLLGLNRSEAAFYDTAMVSDASLTLIFIPLPPGGKNESMSDNNAGPKYDNTISAEDRESLISNPGNYEALEQRIARLEAKLRELQSD